MKAWFSTGPQIRKLHVHPQCDGMESISPQLLNETDIGSLLELFCLPTPFRPCRRCALEPSLVAALGALSSFSGPVVSLSFSAQGHPEEWSPYSDKDPLVTPASPSAAARLQRVCARFDLPVVPTVVGPVSWLRAPASFAQALAPKLHTISPTQQTLTPLVVATAWRLLATRNSALAPVDYWSLARAAVG